MASKCSPFLWGIIGLATVTLIFHLIGFVTPGWLVMKRTINETPRHIGGQFVDGDIFSIGEAMFFRESSDDDDKMPPMEKRLESEHNSDGRPPHHEGPHHGPHHEGPDHGSGDRPPHRPPHHKPGEDSSSDSSHEDLKEMFEKSRSSDSSDSDEYDEDMMKEKDKIIAWMRLKKDAYQGAEIQTSYGLWYSKVCVSPSEGTVMHKRIARFDSKDKDGKDGREWEKSGEMDHHKSRSGKHHHKKGDCKKISTKTAMYYSYIYENPNYFGKNKRTIDCKKIAFTGLREHQIELSAGLAFVVLGLLAAIFGFRDTVRCKYCAYGSIIFMLLACFVTLVPVSRFAHYSVYKDDQKFPVYIHVPYSVISSGLAAILALCTAIVCAGALFISSRKSKSVTWKHLENEPEKKNQNLVFYNDQLPAKPGLYDVCDFSDIKPVEEKTMSLDEPQKTHI